jgi:uncharacterized protein (TIGR03000 family)
MRSRLLSLAGLMALAGVLVLLSPAESQAQRRVFGVGFGGYGYGGYGYGGYGYGGYGYGGLGYGYGYPHYGYGYGNYSLYRPFGYGGYGYGIYGYGGPGSYGNYAPAYVTPYYGSLSYGPSDYAYSPQTAVYQSLYPSNVNQPTNNHAFIKVAVPPDAEVFFDGSPTQQRGPNREFQTPPLDPSRTFTYQIRATWTQNGQKMDQTRTVSVQANRTATVDFNAAQQQNPDQQQTPQKQQNPKQPPPPPQ